MAGVVSYQERLLAISRDHLMHGRVADSLACLERVIHHPNLEPSLSAEANFLWAQARYAAADWSGARESAARALEVDEENPRYHFLLAETLEEEGEREEALDHYAKAARLAPHDSAIVLRYARRMAERKSESRGVRLMHSVYSAHHDSPEVVEEVLEGLVDSGRLDDAELVVAQASYRHPTDERFRRIRDRFRVYRCEMVLAGVKDESEEKSDVLPYRNPAAFAMGKPGGARRPERDRSKDGLGARPSPPVGPARLEPIAIDGGMTTLEILRRSGSQATYAIHETLGLLGDSDADGMARNVSGFFADADSLAKVVRELPTTARKLLTTLVRAGGYVPATTLFQTTGKDAPAPDFAQPLFVRGLAYFGRPTKGKRKGMMVVVPADLLGRLARVLKVKVGE